MKTIVTTVALTIGVVALLSAQTASTVVHGTIKKIDTGTRTVVVMTAKGTQQVVHFTDKTVVHGTATRSAVSGLKEGTEIVARCTTSGAKKTAVEVEKVGKDGLKATDGTISKIDPRTRKVVVRTADGVEHAYDMTADAAADAGKATAKGAKKTGTVTAYYAEEAGKKVVHFFK